MLEVQARTILGKKIKKLRKEGVLPANIYGKGIDSLSIQLPVKEFASIFKKVGETQVITIKLSGKDIPVMVHNTQRDPLTNAFVHADFRKIDLKQKLEANVPVKFIGESEAVEQKKGDLLTLVDELTVEALPNDIPHEIEIDISILKEIDDEIRVENIKLTGNYVFVGEPEKVIVKIAEHKEEEIVPEITPVEGEGEGAEGATEGGAAEGGEEGAQSGKGAEGGEEAAESDKSADNKKDN